MERSGLTLYALDNRRRLAFRPFPALDLRKPSPLHEYTVYGRTPDEYSRETFDTLLKLLGKRKINGFAYWNVTEPVLRQEARSFAPIGKEEIPIIFHYGVFLGSNKELQNHLAENGKFIDEPEKKLYM